ncbi:hypothetical protein JYQ62_08185 [Nostoc sp. UHCC 0702]|nr:hypothetical protein JYQ62_08185 [Nostoc sp. UHCC 0702]
MGITPFPPQDYRLNSRGAGEQGSRGEKFASVILQREGSSYSPPSSPSSPSSPPSPPSPIPQSG